MDAPGEKLLVRLWETVETTVGGLLSPWQARRVGRARLAVRREEELTLAQTERDIEDIRSGRRVFTSDRQLVEASDPERARSQSHDTSIPAAAVRNAVLIREMQGEVNVARALLQAEAELEDDPQEPPERPVEEDWLLRWRDSASKVSTEDLQLLWGRVLAGEVKSPGTFSLRTLEFLKNVSKEEARLIEKLAPFVVSGSFVFKDTSGMLEDAGMTLNAMLRLQDLGIVYPASDSLRLILRTEVPDGFTSHIFCYDRVLVVTHQDATKTAELRGHRLTSLGVEVLKLGAFTPNELYFQQLGRSIRDHGFDVAVGRSTRLTETEVSISIESEL